MTDALQIWRRCLDRLHPTSKVASFIPQNIRKWPVASEAARSAGPSAFSPEVFAAENIMPGEGGASMSANLKTTSWIEKTPGVCGGRACIRNTRITVWGLVNARRLGATDQQLVDTIQGLLGDDLLVAWNYYRQHAAEIDEDIRDNEAD
jgi:uncharacterized protein (DUF433 family)